MNTYRDLIVWQKSIELTKKIYLLTKSFPKEEQFGLTSQIKRAAISIPSNIAEGKLRNSPKELRQFLYIALGSGGELETQLEIAKSVIPYHKVTLTEVEELLQEVMKMLNKLISNLTPRA